MLRAGSKYTRDQEIDYMCQENNSDYGILLIACGECQCDKLL